MKNMGSILLATSAAAVLVLLAVAPAAAMPIPAVAVAGQDRDVVQVRDHDHHGHHHRRDHRWHGRDNYYDRDDESGMLFKSFITGTLFSDRDDRRVYRRHAE